MNSKERNAVQKSLEWIRSNSTIEDDGSVKITVDIPYYAAKEIIARYTRVGKLFPEGTHRRAIKSAIRRWLRYKKYHQNEDQVSAFLEALQVEIEQLERKRRPFHVLMFLNIDRRDVQGLDPISILGDRIVLKHWDWEDLSPLKTADLWKEIRFSDHTNPVLLPGDHARPMPHVSKFTPVLVNVETYDSDAAVSVAGDRLDILRAVLNMSGLLGRFTYFRTAPKHLSDVLPTPICGVFDASGNLVSTYYTVEKYVYNKAKIRKERLTNAEYFLSIFDRHLQYPDTYYHVLGLTRLYQGALDISSPPSAYLAMWQVLESAVTFRHERILQPKIVSRVATLIDFDPLFRDALKLLANLRNDLVHSGEFLERGDDAFFTLKLADSRCLSQKAACTRQ